MAVEISVDELAARLEERGVSRGAGGLNLIDVREDHEYTEAHVPGAVLIPLGTVPDNVERFRSDEPAYVICRSGGRSMQVVHFLAGHGVDAINIAGGTLAWLASGRAVAAGDHPAGERAS